LQHAPQLSPLEIRCDYQHVAGLALRLRATFVEHAKTPRTTLSVVRGANDSTILRVS